MGRKGETSIRGGPSSTQGDRSNCFRSSSLRHDNGMSAERLRARSDVRACDGAGNGGNEVRGPPNSPASKRMAYFARSKITVATPPANANTSVMSLLRPRLAVESAFRRRWNHRDLRSGGCRREARVFPQQAPQRWLAAYSLQAPTRSGVGGRGSFETSFPGQLHICHCSRVERLK